MVLIQLFSVEEVSFLGDKRVDVLPSACCCLLFGASAAREQLVEVV